MSNKNSHHKNANQKPVAKPAEVAPPVNPEIVTEVVEETAPATTVATDVSPTGSNQLPDSTPINELAHVDQSLSVTLPTEDALSHGMLPPVKSESEVSPELVKELAHDFEEEIEKTEGEAPDLDGSESSEGQKMSKVTSRFYHRFERLDGSKGKRIVEVGELIPTADLCPKVIENGLVEEV